MLLIAFCLIHMLHIRDILIGFEIRAILLTSVFVNTTSDSLVAATAELPQPYQARPSDTSTWRNGELLAHVSKSSESYHHLTQMKF